MSATVFLEQLRESSLLSDQQLEEVARRFSQSQQGDTQTLIAELVTKGILTPYQVKQLGQGNAKKLVLGQYRILDEIGRGGFGHVYKALHTLMNRIVALKVISPELIENERVRRWFRREVQATTQLSHPNIVMAHDANEVDGVLFLVMEYVEGADLDTIIKKQGRLPIPRSCEIIRQVAVALQHAYEKGLVHRDIKPANLLIPGYNPKAERSEKRSSAMMPLSLVKVVDFGLARLHDANQNQSLMLLHEKGFVGTPDFVSPEQARDVHNADVRSDIYSLGCTFYYALTGRKPFQAESVLETVVKNLETEPPTVESLRPEVPFQLGAIVRRMMAKDASRRFQTPADLVDELEDYLFSSKSTGQARLPLEPAAAPVADQSFACIEPNATAVVPVLDVWEKGEKRDGADGADQFLPRTQITPLPAGMLQAQQAPEGPAHSASTQGLAQGDTPHSLDLPKEIQRPRSPDQANPQLPVSKSLRETWWRWCAVLEAQATGRKMPCGNEAGYTVLYRELLSEVRSHHAAASGPSRDFFARMEGLVEPWINLKTIAAMDSEGLLSLLRHVRLIDVEMNGAPQKTISWFLIIVTVVLATVLGTSWKTIQEHLRRASTLETFVKANPLLSVSIVLSIALFAFILFLWVTNLRRRT